MRVANPVGCAAMNAHRPRSLDRGATRGAPALRD